MTLLYKLFKLDPETRSGKITATSLLGIIANLLLATLKVIVGGIASSIAIISEGINNYADAMTSILTLVGSKLATKHADAEHPFGHGRIEYITSLVVSAFILVSGYSVLKNSFLLIIHPEEVNVSLISLLVVAGSAIAKYFLGSYTYKVGKKIDSSSLEAVGSDCKNDCFASLITISSAIIFLVFKLNVDAYAGVITSLLILKAGIEVLKNTLDDLIGRPGKSDLAKQLYHEIRNTDGIINAVDLMLHNYGPDSYSGSVNVEIDHNLTIGEAYQFIHALQLRIMHEYHVTLVFGIYAVDNDTPASKKLRDYIAQYCRDHEHVKSYHAVYIEKKTNNIYCDLIVDYEVKNWDEVREDFLAYMAKKYPKKHVILTIETEFV